MMCVNWCFFYCFMKLDKEDFVNVIKYLSCDVLSYGM